MSIDLQSKSSILVSRMLINKKIKELEEKKINIYEYFYKCAIKFRPELFELTELTELTDDEDDIDDIDDINKCKKCELYNQFLRIDGFQEVCVCGTIRSIPSTGIKFEEPKQNIINDTNLIKMMISGKNFTVDLQKLNNWILDTNPLYNSIELIKSTIDELLLIQTNIDQVKQTAIGLLNESVRLNEELNPLLNKNDVKKKNFIGLYIYYSGIINAVKISLLEISTQLDISIPDIKVANNIFQELFKNTNFKYLKIETNTNSNNKLKLNSDKLIIFNRIQEHLITKEQIIEPIENKYEAAIIYYIYKNQKLNKNKDKITLSKLSELYNVTSKIITTNKNIIESFYLNPENEELYKELF